MKYKVLETYPDCSHRWKNYYCFPKISVIGLSGVPSEWRDTSSFEARPISVGDLTLGEIDTYARLLSIRKSQPILYSDLMSGSWKLSHPHLVPTGKLLYFCLC